MSRSPQGRAKLRASGKKPMPLKVADEFVVRGKGAMARLPQRVRKSGPASR